jgi:hypothetical protein
MELKHRSRRMTEGADRGRRGDMCFPLTNAGRESSDAPGAVC